MKKLFVLSTLIFVAPLSCTKDENSNGDDDTDTETSTDTGTDTGTDSDSTSEEAPEIEWEESYSGSGEEAHGHYIITCSDGGFLQVGETGFIDNNSARILAVKVDSNGDLEWKKEFGSKGHNLGNCAVEMPDGNYVIAGSMVRVPSKVQH